MMSRRAMFAMPLLAINPYPGFKPFKGSWEPVYTTVPMSLPSNWGIIPGLPPISALPGRPAEWWPALPKETL